MRSRSSATAISILPTSKAARDGQEALARALVSIWQLTEDGLDLLLARDRRVGQDLDIFLKLMAMDDGAFARRFDGSAAEFAGLFPARSDLVTEEAGRKLNDALGLASELGRPVCHSFKTCANTETE